MSAPGQHPSLLQRVQQPDQRLVALLVAPGAHPGLQHLVHPHHLGFRQQQRLGALAAVLDRRVGDLGN
jgi:hypothetical protein